MWFLYLSLLVLVLVIVDRWKSKEMINLHKELGTDIKYVPVLGHVHKLIGNSEERMTVLQDLGRKSYKNIYSMASIWVLNYTWVVISEPEAANFILKSCLDKGRLTSFARHLFGNGSIFASVNIWQPRRKILAPLFGLKYLNKFIEVFEKNSIVMVDELASVVGKGNFSIEKYINAYSFDSSCETTLGESFNSQRQSAHPFLVALTNYAENIIARMFNPCLHIGAVYKRTAAYAQQVEYKKTIFNIVENNIKKTKKSGKEENYCEDENNNSNKINTNIQSFLASLTEHSGYNDVELREEALILLLAATETTALSSGYTCVLLAHHSDVQDKVYQEIRDVFGDSSRSICSDDLNNLKYLDAVVRESLRLYPPAPILARGCHSDVKLPSGIILPKGTNAIINTWAIHRNPHYWGTDADEFKPERFINVQREQLAAFLPFSSGPRNCLGYHYAMLTMKANLATLLRRYRIVPATSFKYDDRNPLRVKFSVTMKHVHEYEVQLEHRVTN